MQSVHSARHGTYVVTFDVASRLQAFRLGALTVPGRNDQLFRNFHRELFEKMRQALPGAYIHTIGMGKVRRRIWREVERCIQSRSSQVALSACQEIADTSSKSEGLVLNINRLFNTEGEMIGHGPRPGFAPLEKQFEKLATQIAGRSVIVIDDGAFTGGTLRFILNRLNGLGLKITAVVIGFCCTRAYAVLKEAFVGELVIVDPLENLIDWIPDHDLIPFIPNCGRVLGELSQEGMMPVRTADGVSCAYPYILPFGKMEKWATVPAEGAQSLSKFCLDTSLEIFSRVGRHEGHQITVGELIAACPRVSFPIEIGTHESFPTFDMKVISFLKQLRWRLD